MMLVLAYDLRRSGGIERLSLQVLRALDGLGIQHRVVGTQRLGPGWIGRQLGRCWFVLQLLWWLPQAKAVFSMHVLLLRPLRLCDRWGITPKVQPRYCWLHGIEVWGSHLEDVCSDLFRCTALAASSSFTAGQVQSKIGLMPPITVVHPCIAITEQPPQRNQMVEGDHWGGLQLLTVARMDTKERYKGHDQVFQALQLLRESGKLSTALRWRVVGGGDDQQRLQDKTVALGLEAWVQFLGPLSDQSLLEEYLRCQLVVMPSAYGITADSQAQGEGFGITYLEAAALGRPSIGALEGGHTDLILDGQTGWLVSNDPKDLAMLFSRLMAEPSRIKHCGLQAQERARDFFKEELQWLSLRSLFKNS